MSLKLSARQQAQLTYLQSLPPKFSRIKHTVELMASLKADEATVRGLGRQLDEIRANAQALSLGGLAETCGLMSTISRRGGGLQMKVRGLRELMGSLQVNYEGALRAASQPEAVDHGGPADGTTPG
jgi:type II secretory pathway component PulM